MGSSMLPCCYEKMVACHCCSEEMTPEPCIGAARRAMDVLMSTRGEGLPQLHLYMLHQLVRLTHWRADQNPCEITSRHGRNYLGWQGERVCLPCRNTFYKTIESIYTVLPQNPMQHTCRYMAGWLRLFWNQHQWLIVEVQWRWAIGHWVTYLVCRLWQPTENAGALQCCQL